MYVFQGSTQINCCLQVFAQANEKFNVNAALEESNENGVPQLECITPLRLLLESERNVKRWNEEVKDMEAHDKIRSQKTQWKSDHVNIVEYLRKRLKLQRCAVHISIFPRLAFIVSYICERVLLHFERFERRFSDEHIQTICGILEINTFEVRTTKRFTARGLYPTVAMMNHSCVSNTSHSISPSDYKYVNWYLDISYILYIGVEAGS